MDVSCSVDSGGPLYKYCVIPNVNSSAKTKFRHTHTHTHSYIHTHWKLEWNSGTFSICVNTAWEHIWQKEKKYAHIYSQRIATHSPHTQKAQLN